MEREREWRRAATYHLWETVLQTFSIFTINRPVSATTRIGSRTRDRERRSERASERGAALPRITALPCTLPR